MYQLTNEQKDSYFINTLGDPARTFYLSNYKLDVNFEQVSELMVKEYNSNSSRFKSDALSSPCELNHSWKSTR
eukprot:IDg1230t1